MKPGWLAIAAALAATAPATGLACGACDEDKIAATYDHAVIDAAIAGHRQVVFVAIDGPVDAQRIAMRLTAAAAKVRGVQAGTLRTSLAPPAFSFVLDTTQTPTAAVAGFRNAVGDSTARLTVVKIMRDGVLQQAN
jgi:hypothetical protein